MAESVRCGRSLPEIPTGRPCIQAGPSEFLLGEPIAPFSSNPSLDGLRHILGYLRVEKGSGRGRNCKPCLGLCPSRCGFDKPSFGFHKPRLDLQLEGRRGNLSVPRGKMFRCRAGDFQLSPKGVSGADERLLGRRRKLSISPHPSPSADRPERRKMRGNVYRCAVNIHPPCGRKGCPLRQSAGRRAKKEMALHEPAGTAARAEWPLLRRQARGIAPAQLLFPGQFVEQGLRRRVAQLHRLFQVGRALLLLSVLDQAKA